MLAFIHRTTAKVCDDIKQPSDELELKEPHPVRRYARLAVIAAAGAVLVAAVVVMAMRIQKIQSERKLFPSNSTRDVEAWLSHPGRQNHTITCPCQTRVLSWCNVTTFYIYRSTAPDASNFSILAKLTNEEGGDYLYPVLCNTSVQLRKSICIDIFTPLLNQKDVRTYVSTAIAFIDPILLYKEIAIHIDTNAYEQSSAFSYLQLLQNQNDSYTYVKRQTDLIRSMQLQFYSNSTSSSQDYWNAAQEIRRDYNTNISFGMEVSWERYLQICAPPYCDEEFSISMAIRVFRAMAQVGGVTTLIGLALKLIVWPSFMFAFRLPKHISPVPSA